MNMVERHRDDESRADRWWKTGEL